MNAVIAASGLGKAYRRAWTLRDCTLAIQATETAIYLALALALAGYCFRRLRRLS